ncbi:DUF3987 domain-containing protein [Dankookia sp. P2]|uniref:DUF3987 domain-containing protein n=1 Tax=Dankookia sp. P2 TaxID=3423955 RepID=UPI003D670170
MNAAAPLQADRREIDRFVAALFRYADGGTFVSLRSFHDGGQKVFAIEAHALTGDLDALIDAALNQASRAARAGSPVVFAPPIATFGNSSSATEADLCNGLALSVECDRAPTAARTKLESLIGPATVIVASGGEWLNPDTGEYEPKLHLHWRLSEPTRDQAEHAALKTARSLAMEIVGADPTSKPTVHPLRWPGSWHRKAQPRLARIVAEADAELDLDEALERLREARAVVRPTGAGASAPLTDSGHGESRETAELIAAILSGSDYHAPLVALAMRYLKAGMPDGQAVQTLRGFMLAVPERLRDLKDGTVQPGRWQARSDDIWRTVSTARAKLGEANAVAKDGGSQETQSAEWPDPVDFLASDEATGAPVLHSDHVPDALAPFILDVAERMGVDPAMVALGALVALATVIHDDFRLQPKRHDDEWTESPRIWGAIVGDPSVRKSPVVAAVTRPLAALEAQFHTVWDQAMRQYKIDHARWKKEKDADPAAEPVRPLRERVMIEDTTTEAISEVLRTDSEATMRAPAGKVLVRQDELSEFLANLDRYRASGGGGDRGAYLRLYNGGAFSVDRVKRGTLTIPNWSATFLGGIQPEPIQRIAKEAADDGLLQRFMYVVPGPSVAGVDRRPDAAARASV